LRATRWNLPQSAQRGQRECSHLLCVLCVSAVNQTHFGKGAALACGPLASPAGSPASGLLRRPHPLARRSPLAGDALEFTAECAEGPTRMQPSSLRSLRLCDESNAFRGRRGPCVRSAGITCWVARKRAPTSSVRWHHLLGRPQAGSYVVSTRRLVGARLRATRWNLPQSAQRGQRECSHLLCVLCVSAMNQTHFGEGAALACGPLASPAGSPASGLLRRQSAGITCWVARKRAPTSSAPVGS
jgi:hypothetical protein